MEVMETVFDNMKIEHVNAALLRHSKHNVLLSIMMDISDVRIGTVLQQCVNRVATTHLVHQNSFNSSA